MHPVVETCSAGLVLTRRGATWGTMHPPFPGEAVATSKRIYPSSRVFTILASFIRYDLWEYIPPVVCIGTLDPVLRDHSTPHVFDLRVVGMELGDLYATFQMAYMLTRGSRS